ncbi:hypothetical protein FGIG_11722 [Fasciola gigantica]|uniref:Secreted protein n=1 Tax=Fasciola gigantica TaxID=46835 RepID=A0A504YI34_FASGI|nr:hypothetical protein FGIG_11722 [Fasciola gigantica]
MWSHQTAFLLLITVIAQTEGQTPLDYDSEAIMKNYIEGMLCGRLKDIGLVGLKNTVELLVITKDDTKRSVKFKLCPKSCFKFETTLSAEPQVSNFQTTRCWD